MLPCQDLGGYRGYGFQLGNTYHIGHDFNQPAETHIIAVDHGIVTMSDEINGFGSDVINGVRQAGGVIIVRHENKYGGKYYALYGHVKRNKIKDESVNKGEIIGELIPYFLMYQGKKIRADHLHFTICIMAEFITGNWGYRESLIGTVDPLEYLKKYSI